MIVEYNVGHACSYFGREDPEGGGHGGGPSEELLRTEGQPILQTGREETPEEKQKGTRVEENRDRGRRS